jgi:YggT family protein
MLSNAGAYLVETFFGLFAMALLLRFILQAVRAPARNPLSQFLVALTNFIVVPVRKFVPGLWGIDLSTLLLAWLVKVLEIGLILALSSKLIVFTSTTLLVLTLIAAIGLIKLTIYIVMVTVVVYAFLSWLAPYSPAMPLFGALARPFLAWFRRIPPIGNVDLSPLFLVVTCQLLLMLPVQWLESVGWGLLR